MCRSTDKMRSYEVLISESVVFFLFFSSKALPRRRVSVAVVPKFNLLNIPGQTPAAAGSNVAPGALPVVVSPISHALPRQLLCCSLSAASCN